MKASDIFKSAVAKRGAGATADAASSAVNGDGTATAGATAVDLAEHDKQYHGGHYEGGRCKYREEHGIATSPAPDGAKMESTGDGEETVATKAEVDVDAADKDKGADIADKGKTDGGGQAEKNGGEEEPKKNKPSATRAALAAKAASLAAKAQKTRQAEQTQNADGGEDNQKNGSSSGEQGADGGSDGDMDGKTGSSSSDGDGGDKDDGSDGGGGEGDNGNSDNADDGSKYKGLKKENEGVRSYTTKAENRGTSKKPDWHEVKSVTDKKGREKSTKNTHDSFGSKGKHDKWYSLPVIKDKPPTPNFDSFKSVEPNPAKKISELDPNDLYTRSDKPIEYAEGEDKEGKPRYEWKRNGERIPDEEALRLEAALREKYTQGLQQTYTGVKVRPDFASAFGQVLEYRDADGESWQKYSDSHIYASAVAKYRNVTRLLPQYEEIKRRIHSDCERGVPEAMLAYFMQRTKIRAGSDSKAKAGRGATNLTRGNFSLSDDGETVYVSFNGKSKQWWHVTLKDKVLFDYISKRKDELAEQGEGANDTPLFPATYGRLKSYLKQVSIDLVDGDAEEAFSPHDFRRLGATKVALDYLAENAQGVDPVKDEKKWQDRVVKAVVAAAQHLNDEPVTVFENYIAPNLLFSDSHETMLKYFPFLKGKVAGT